MVESCLNWLSSYRNIPIIVGCSGGVDSMGLVHFLHSNGFSIHVLHVNYHKRGEESDVDMQLVASFCTENKIPYEIHHFKRKLKSGNFQELARDYRYQLLHEVAFRKQGVIALAHHREDQIETFFMNVMRKSGMVGLAAMPKKNGSVIRPFLDCSKKDIIDYAITNHVPWREDASNQSVDYVRNKWRLEFLPMIQKTIPTINETVIQLIQAFQSNLDELTIKIQPIHQQIINSHSIDILSLQRLSDDELFLLWKQLNQPSNLFHRFKELIDFSKGKFILAKAPLLKIINEGEELSFVLREDAEEKASFQVENVSSLPQIYTKNCIYLNAEKIVGELTLTTWEEGDKIASIGMKGMQLVSKILKDAKVLHRERKSVLVLKDEKQIHWVVGYKIGRLAVATEQTLEISKVTIS